VLHDYEPHFHVELSKVAGIGGRDGKLMLARREDSGGVNHVACPGNATELSCSARTPIIERLDDGHRRAEKPREAHLTRTTTFTT